MQNMKRPLILFKKTTQYLKIGKRIDQLFHQGDIWMAHKHIKNVCHD